MGVQPAATQPVRGSRQHRHRRGNLRTLRRHSRWAAAPAFILALLLVPSSGSAQSLTISGFRLGPAAGLPSAVAQTPDLPRGELASEVVVGAPAQMSAGQFTSDTVNRTTVLFNDTVTAGSEDSAPIEYPNSLAIDPATRSVWVGAYGIGQVPQNALGEVNLTTGQVVFSNGTAGGIAGFSGLVYDASNDVLFGGIDGGNVGVWNATSGKFLKLTSVSAQPSMALDTATNQLYVVGNANVTVLNASSYSVAATVYVHNTPEALAYDPSAHAVVATNSGLFSAGTSYLSFINDTSYSWFDTNIPNTAAGHYADPSAVAYDPANDTIVVPCPGSGEFEILNATSGAVVNSVAEGNAPSLLQFDPDNNGFFASSGGGVQILLPNFSVSHNLPVAATGSAEFDPGTNELLVTNLEAWAGGGLDEFNATTGGLIAIVNLSAAAPLGLAFSPDGSTLFVAGYGGRAIWLLNATSSLVAGSMASAATGGPWAVVPDGAASLMFISETNSGRVEAWNATPPFAIRDQTSINPSDPNLPFDEGMALDPSNGRLLVADSGENNLTLLNLTTPSHQIEVGVGSAPSDVINLGSAGEYAVVDSGSDKLVLINSTSLKLVGNATTGANPAQEVYDPLVGSVIVTNTGSDTISVVSISSLHARPVAVGVAPVGIAFDPWSDELLVADSGSQNLTVLNASTFAVTGSLALGQQPEDLAVDASGSAVAVSEYGSDAIAFVAIGGSNHSVRSFSVHASESPAAGPAPLNATFLALATGGSPPYSFTYDFGDGSLMDLGPIGNTSHTYVAPGSFDAVLWANDSTGASDREVFNVSVLPNQLKIGTPLETRPDLDVGQATTLSTVVTGGAPPYTISWIGLPAGCGTANSTTLSCAPVASGDYAVAVRVTDSVGGNLTSNGTLLNVSSQLNLSGPATVPDAIAAGRETTISSEASGGRPPYRYLWTALPPGCLPTNAPTLSCDPTEPGSYSVVVQVTDANNESLNATSEIPLNVVSQLVVGTPTVSSSSTDVGVNVTLQTTVAGGSGGYSFQWNGLPECEWNNSSKIACAPGKTGIFAVSVIASDSWGDRATSSPVTLVVNADPSVTLGWDNLTVALGTPASITATVHGGTGVDSFSYLGLPAGCSTADTSQLSCVPTTPGKFQVTVQVVDSTGAEAAAYANLTVVPGVSQGAGGGVAEWELAALGLGAVGIAGVLLAALGLRSRGPRSRSAGPDMGREPGSGL